MAKMVDIVEEAGLSVIASLHDMLGYPGKIESRQTWHLSSLAESPTKLAASTGWRLSDQAAHPRRKVHTDLCFPVFQLAMLPLLELIAADNQSLSARLRRDGKNSD
jgi:hypothetical protein